MKNYDAPRSATILFVLMWFGSLSDVFCIFSPSTIIFSASLAAFSIGSGVASRKKEENKKKEEEEGRRRKERRKEKKRWGHAERKK